MHDELKRLQLEAELERRRLYREQWHVQRTRLDDEEEKELESLQE